MEVSAGVKGDAVRFLIKGSQSRNLLILPRIEYGGVSQPAKELMERYLRGDDGAFRELFALTAPLLRRYLLRLCGQNAMADDLVQQTFLKIHRARGAFVVGAEPLPWFYTIAHRTFLDHARAIKRAKVSVSKHAELPDIPAPSAEPEVDADKMNAALEALSKLSESYRQAIVLTKLEGMSFEQAAKIAGVSPGAMKVRAHRGYEQLRKHFGGSHEND